MSYAVDTLASTVNDLIGDLSQGRKSIVWRTGVGGGKMLTIVATPKS